MTFLENVNKIKGIAKMEIITSMVVFKNIIKLLSIFSFMNFVNSNF